MPRRLARLRRALVLLVCALLATTFAVQSAPPAAAADAAFDVAKTVLDPQTSYGPGDTFAYQIEVNCSSSEELGCIDMALTDALPAPLVLDPGQTNPVTVTTAGGDDGNPRTTPRPPTVSIDRARNSFTVTGADLLDGDVGLIAGRALTILVAVQVPETVGADFNGQTVTNTTSVTGSNADEETDSADISLAVTTTLVAGLDKSVSPRVVPAVQGRPVTWTLAPRNASNQTVDTITVQDPATVPAASPWNYVDFTGVEVTTAPPTTTATTTEYYVAGAWTSTLPGDPSEVEGVRVRFTGSFAPGAAGEVTVRTVTDENVDDIPQGSTQTLTNTAATTVAKAGDTSDPVNRTASATLSRTDPTVDITKSFADATLTSGQETTVRLQSQVGDQDVHTLTINEPSDTADGFAAQGLSFGGFADIEWPETAVSASITYQCVGGGTAGPLTTTTANQLPAAPGDCEVDRYSVTFTAADGTNGIQSQAYAALTANVTATTDITEETSSTNVVDTAVTDTDDRTGTDSAQAPFTIRPLEVFTEASKSIQPSSILEFAGSDANVSLSGKVTEDSTVGSNQLVITDPAVVPSTFFQSFTIDSINPTDVAACTTMTVRYWSASQGVWVELPGAVDLVGPINGFTLAIPAAIQTDLGGIQFDIRPATGGNCATLLPPGFTALPNLGVVLRPGVDVGDDPVTFTNVVNSHVENPDSINKTDDDTADDGIEVRPITGEGPDLVDKQWLDDTVNALSAATRTAQIRWSTGGLPLDRVVISDPASAGELSDLATSVYDAFDLRAIQPITTSSDPLIARDQITTVELYIDGAWVDITADACQNGCVGQFGGYVLSDQQRADAVGLRMTIEGRDGVVARSVDRRPIDLDFTIRDTRRSDANEYVLGQYHPYTYNTDDAGVVLNTVQAQGFGDVCPLDGVCTSRDGDPISILDQPVNVDITKSFDQDELGVPQPGTDPADYPLATATVTAQNTSATRVSSLLVADPGTAQPTPTLFDSFNLYDIDAISIPDGLTKDDITVTVTGLTPSEYSYDDALALTPTELADATGFSVLYTTGEPDIAPQTRVTVETTYQLRATTRGADDPVVAPSTKTNQASVNADSPGRIACPGTGCSTGYDTDSDSLDIVDADYQLTAAKSINRTSVYEDEAKNYTTTLRAQPNGNARTVLISLTDVAPTFWNAMDYTGSSVRLPTPVNSARMDVLTGVTSAVEGGALVYRCGGDTDLSACWVNGTWVDATATQIITFALPTGVTAGQVLGVRYQFRQLVNGQPVQWERPFNPNIQVGLRTTRRDTLRIGLDGISTDQPVPTTRPGMTAAPGETVQGRISNSVQVHGDAQFGPDQPFTDDESASASTLLRHRVNAIQVEKYPGSTPRPPAINPNGSIPYLLRVTNSGAWAMTGLTLTDTFTPVDALVSPGDTAFSFALFNESNVSQPVDGFAASLAAGSGEVQITIPDGFVFRPGWRIELSANLTFKPGLDPDTLVDNTLTARSDRDFETCRRTSDGSFIPQNTTNVATCAADTTVQPLITAPIDATKLVKGVEAGVGSDDLGVQSTNTAGSAIDSPAKCLTPQTADGYYGPGCSPIIKPGGVESWRLQLTNGGNSPARVLAMVDRLPGVGDSSVNVNSPRNSRYAVSLLSSVTSNLADLGQGGVLRAYWSTSSNTVACNRNAIQVHTALAAESAACAFNWTEYTSATPEAALAGARSVKFVAEWPEQVGLGLQPNATLRIEFQTRSPRTLPSGTSDAAIRPLAFNSFALASRTQVTASQPIAQASLVAEPTKVGVAMATGALALDKVVVAPGFSGPVTLPATYTLGLTCTSDGQPVTLRTAAGGDASRVSVRSDGTVTTYNGDRTINLPLFSSCVLAEQGVPAGVTVSYDPDDRTVTALRSLDGLAGVANGFVPASLSDTELTVTNTYTAGGFTVSKAVDAGGAVNQDGDPIGYDQVFSFTASCRYLGSEVLAVADRTFTLTDGASKQVSDVPTGATCTVSETGSGGAEPSVVVTQGDGTPSTPSASAAFTIVQGAATVTRADFTNTYSVGAVQITKTVTGAGGDDWGNGSFDLRMVCTLAAADPDTVYDDTTTVSKAAPVWTVTNLPTDASCTVTEVNSGGANDVSITPATVTVGDDPDDPVQVGVTNTFTVGSVVVQKVLDGPAAGAGPIVDGSYTVELTCTRVVNGDTVEVGIPGGASRTITGADSVTYAGLPTGAACSAAETASDPAAASTAISPESVVVGDDADTDPVEFTVTNTFTQGSMVIAKVVDGPGAQLWGNETFTVSVVCTLGSAQTEVFDDQFSLSKQEPEVTVDGLPTGAECAVTEPEVGGADASVIAPESVTIGGPDADPVAVTVTNTFTLGSVVVQKVLDGPAAGAGPVVNGSYTVDLTCTREVNGDTVEVEIPGGASRTITGATTATYADLPTGAACSVAETASDPAAASTVISPESVVVGDDADSDPVQFTVTNTFTQGSMVITKVVDGPGAQLWGNEIFTVHVTCTLGSGAGVILDEDRAISKASPEVTIDALPTGAECAVTEPAIGGANASVISPESVTIGGPGDDPVAVTVTNTFTVGSLSVEKRLGGQAAGSSPIVDGSYTVELTCTRVVNGEDVDVAIPGGARHTFTGAGSYTYENLPTGASCTVTEPVSDPKPSGTFISPEMPLVIGDDAAPDSQPLEVVVQNDFNASYLQIVKQISGAGGADFGSGPFTFQVTCGLRDQNVLDQEVTLIPEPGADTVSSEVLGWVPIGATCVTTETDNGGADFVPAPVTIVTTEDQTQQAPALIAFSNQFSAGTLSLSKVISGTDPDRAEGLEFTVRVTCQVTVPGPEGPIAGLAFSDDVTIAGGERLDLVDENGDPILLPLGSSCWGEETDTGGADRSAMNFDSVDDAATVTDGTPDDLQLLSLVADNTFDTVPPTPPTPPTPSEPGTPSDPPTGGLPNTGGPTLGLLGLAALLIAGGAGALAAGKRRSRH